MSVPPPPNLSEEDGRALLTLARAALQAHFGTTQAVRPEYIIDAARLAALCGVFVPLHLDGEMRGCVGSLDHRSPLYLAVGAAAVAAALADPRFDPLPRRALERTVLDVTVLGVAARIADPGVIRIGRHGLVVSRGGRRGLLLPQVAVERGWDVETFLSETCRKAGLAPGAWRATGTRLEAFEARVFREDRRAARDAARAF